MGSEVALASEKVVYIFSLINNVSIDVHVSVRSVTVNTVASFEQTAYALL